jgi:hypothetical protein
VTTDQILAEVKTVTGADVNEASSLTGGRVCLFTLPPTGVSFTRTST